MFSDGFVTRNAVDAADKLQVKKNPTYLGHLKG